MGAHALARGAAGGVGGVTSGRGAKLTSARWETYPRRATTALVVLLVAAALGACVPGTYYAPNNYARRLRLFDRGQYENAILSGMPLAEKGDCHCQYR